MKIAVVVYEFPSITETFIVNQITGLLEAGHDVDIFAFEKNGKDVPCHEKVSQYNLLGRTTYFSKFPSGRMGRVSKAMKIILRYLFKRPDSLRKCFNIKKYGWYESLDRLLRCEPFLAKEYSIVHCQFGPLGRSFVFLKDIFDIKFITAFRGYDITKLVKEKPQGFYDELFQKGDLFLPVCRHFADEIVRLGCPPERVHVLYSGIDVEEFTYKKRNFDFRNSIKILTVGRLTQKKGIEFAVRAVSEIVGYHKNVEYTIVGSGPRESVLKQIAKSLDLEGQVKFLPHMIDKDIREMYGQADIFVLPCVTAENHDREGIPNVLKEAMATGLPVISTVHSGIPELVKDGESGFLLKERDVPALVERIEYLITHPEVCLSMGREGRNFVEKNFDSRNLDQRLEELYRGIISINKPKIRMEKQNVPCHK